mmetsp:Transcript_13905/g.37306  ORF Transcript_13905/g.37306 Transcript_13905/m.37306 type:complete len:364 (-) Transcript_13905:1068-2159(-)
MWSCALRGARWLPCTASRAIPFVPVALVLFAICSGYYLVVFKALLPALRNAVALSDLSISMRRRIALVALMVLFHINLLLICASYTLAAFVDPGAPPADFRRPRLDSSSPRARAMLRSLSFASRLHERSSGFVRDPSSADGLRYCKHCATYKPDRSHHCSHCGRCVLKMDHHCAFIANCVGFYNHKFFMLFVIVAWFGCVCVAVAGFRPFKAAISASHRSSDDAGNGLKQFDEERAMRKESLEIPVIIVGFVLNSSFALALSFFVPFHAYLVSLGRTTIELFEFSDPRRISHAQQYDLGCADNWRQVFGAEMWLWPLPTRIGIPGDGVEFPIASQLRSHGQYQRIARDPENLSQFTGSLDDMI